MKEDKVQNSPGSMAFSPTATQEAKDVTPENVEFSFKDAVDFLLAGAKIHKLEWKDKGFYGFMKDTKLTLHRPDGKDDMWILTEGDLVGDDYIVIK